MSRHHEHGNPRARAWLQRSTLAAAAALTACGGGGGDGGTGTVGASASASASTSASAADAQAQALAKSTACQRRNNNTYDRLLECVTLRGVRSHQRALQDIANDNDGTRASGTPGFEASADYVAGVLEKAGYKVTRQPFDFRVFTELAPAVLEKVAPETGPVEALTLGYSASGDVTAAVSQPAVNATTTFRTGCEAADFAGFTAGHIALIRRGGCTFALKATNANAAGASGVVIYNNVAGEPGFTLGNDFELTLPVVAVTQAEGDKLAALGGLQLHVKTSTQIDKKTSSNVIAESKRGNPTNIVMVGAHLDSVAEGPGINDNGSGTAAVLETAVQLAKVKPRNKLRFALWGAEEANLVGSNYYVANLSEEKRNRIALYLNFDMIGSPNPVTFIYDGDNSDNVGAGPGPTGSAVIEETFETFYRYRNLPFKGTDFDGRSDYGPFIAAGIPSGGLFTGAEGLKTADEAALFGGTAGQAYDPCYHQACDTFANVNLKALDVNSDAVAYSTLRFAMDTTGVNGRSLRSLEKKTMKPRWNVSYPKVHDE